MALPVRTDENRTLRCPSCDERLTEVTAVPLESRLGKRYALRLSALRSAAVDLTPQGVLDGMSH